MYILFLTFFLSELVLGNHFSIYVPKIDLLGLEISTWHVMGWMNIFLGKIAILFYGYKRGWNFSEWVTIILFATTGAAIASFLLPTIVGTLIGFLGCLYLGKRLVGFQHDIGTVIALFIATAFAIGRVGCLLNGCCFGSITTLPWGIEYPIGTPAHWLHLFTDLISNTYLNSLSVHPIQLYETIFHIISAILIVVLRKRFKNKNAILLFYFGSYLIFRFFIEFIRDMNNVWWSALSLGPLSLFQWFLVFVALALIIYGAILEKKYRPILKKVKSDYSTENNSLLILCCFITVLIFRNQMQTIHLVQLAIILPMSTFLHLIELKKRHAFFYPIPRYVAASIFALLFSTPIISQIESRLDSNQSIKTNQKEYSKRWVYTINENNNTLLRIGNRGMSFQEFNRRKQLLNLFSKQTSETKDIYDKMRNNKKSGIQYYGSIGGGKQSYTASGCGGGETSYDFFHLAAGLGVEKIKIKESTEYSFSNTTLKGARVNFGLASGQITSTRTKYGGPFGVSNEGTIYSSSNYDELLIALHMYGNLNYNWIGIGGGPSVFFEEPYLLPNFHIRIGPSKFNIQAGLSDRYVGVYNPLSFNLSIGSKLENYPSVNLGIMNQYSENSKSGFFIQTGNPIGLTLLAGPSGFSLALRHDFFK